MSSRLAKSDGTPRGAAADGRRITHRDKLVTPMSGWTMLAGVILLALAFAGFMIAFIVVAASTDTPNWWLFGFSMAAIILFSLLMPGFFTINPNYSRVLLLFGDYVGTVRAPGFHWANPFYSKPMLNLRIMNLEVGKLKVNDKRGNPIEIAAVVLWRIVDSAQAVFDVGNTEEFVRVQSETALRHLANKYPYDHGEEGEVTLRSAVDEVSHTLRDELQERLEMAGVVVEDTRLTHLAYSAEISAVMLRRQQAEAVIAARQKIVHGAVSMVEMALRDLASRDVVTLDEERKAAMVSNLLVVLCSESEAKPVINAGTLYG
jgi:regulator of protease activity HflC (stomatin/prohibitin superfamily)